MICYSGCECVVYVVWVPFFVGKNEQEKEKRDRE